MPEEHNRVLIDHLADLCAAPTALAADHLRSEGIAEDCIRITGNTGVEAVERLLPAPDDQLRIVDSYGAAPGAYVLATIHRPENTDDAQRLRPILEGLAGLASKVLLPLHPRTHAAADRHGLGGLLDAVCVVPPLPPTSFLALLRQARLVVSDSGGIQEEVAAVGRYVLVVRRSTERPEALGVFSELVAPDDVGGRAEGLLATDLDRSGHPNPFGDGTASAQISEAVLALAG